MGEVYRATDTKLKRQVAIKVLPESVDGDPDRLARLQREAEVLASLNHPNIAAIHGLEESDGLKALVMEFVEGPTLADRIAQRAIPIDEALPIAKQIAEALEAAHEQGIIHRDLKPANIKVRPDGTVKLLDFGLAMEQRSGVRGQGTGAPASEAPTISLAAPQAGMILGTAAYMSPEQASGKPVDKRSDLWSFGAVLLEMLSGRRVFEGETIAHVLAAVLTREPDWTTLPAETPAPIRRLLRRCLEKDRHKRFDSASAARLEIDDALTLPAAEASAASSRGAGPGVRAANAVDLKQEIRFCTAPDGVQLAYSMVGQGPPLMKTGNWMTHLEFDLESPIWRHLYRELAKDHTLVRYDARGNGLSDRTVDTISFDAFVSDLEAVVDAMGIPRFALLGISQGCAISIAYAVRYPERVSHLILYGGFAVGSNRLARSAAQKEEDDALLTLTRLGWGKENPAFRQLFTSQFMPGGTQEQADWFNELQRTTVSAEVAARIVEANADTDVTALLPRVKVPTLVLHARGDARVPFESGRRMAAGIPGARFVTLPGRNHLFLESEPAFGQFLEHTRTFLAA